MIRAAGFENLGLDLMYGLPGQSLDTWLQTLETALGFSAGASLLLSVDHCGEARRPPYTPLARRRPGAN